jgi:transposase InsO family protein
VWAYDFVSERTHDGRPLKVLTLIDEYSRECLALLVERNISSDDVLYCLADMFIQHGIPDHIRSDNGPEFTAKLVREWLSTRILQCAVERRGFTVGEIPTRQLSLQPVATGAVVEVTKRSKPLVKGVV